MYSDKKKGKYEYKCDYSDWYLQIRIQILSNTKFISGYKSYTSMHIYARMADFTQGGE